MLRLLFVLLLISQSSIAQLSTLKGIGTDLSFSNPLFFDNELFATELFRTKKIVMLGELSHGDGTTLLAKSKLVKFLHEKHNFNTIAFETGLINCDVLWQSLSKGTECSALAKDHLYDVWGNVEQTKGLLQYIDQQRRNGTPLKVVGLDPQFSGKRNVNALFDLLNSALENNQKSYLQSNSYTLFKKEMLSLARWLVFPDKEDHVVSKNEMHLEVEKIEALVLENIDKSLHSLWRLYFQNIKVFIEIKWENNSANFRLRDSTLFENLNHHLKATNNHKIIVWAATAHLVRADYKFTSTKNNNNIAGITKFGDRVFNLYGSDCYVIAAATYTGRLMIIPNKEKAYRVTKRKKGSLEWHLRGVTSGLVDLKSFENKMNLDKYDATLFWAGFTYKANWSAHLDGVIFIREMTPITFLE